MGMAEHSKTYKQKGSNVTISGIKAILASSSSTVFIVTSMMLRIKEITTGCCRRIYYFCTQGRFRA